MTDREPDVSKAIGRLNGARNEIRAAAAELAPHAPEQAEEITLIAERLSYITKTLWSV